MQQWVARRLLAELGDPDEQYTLGDVVQFPHARRHRQLCRRGAGGAGDGAVRFDFNHPLAGQPVVFEVQLIGVL